MFPPQPNLNLFFHIFSFFRFFTTQKVVVFLIFLTYKLCQMSSFMYTLLRLITPLIGRFKILFVLLLAVVAQAMGANEDSVTDRSSARDYDVAVIGGTPAGIAAAVAAGRAGKTVVLIEQSPVLGGMLSSGVIRLDDLYVESNSGVMEEFRQRVKAYHRTELAADPLVKAHLNRDPRFPWNVAEGRAWEPHTAARIYAEIVAEIGTITTHFNEVAVGVEIKENRVTGVVTQNRDNQGKLGEKQAYTAKVIIDATYESDLAAFAKVPFRIGREARSEEEPHAGRIYTNFFRGVPGTLKATILPESTGEADDRSQAFTYRLTGKDYGRPDHPYRIKEPPPNYDPAKYRWNSNNKPIIPNRKFDLLGISWGGDLTGYGTRWVLADWEERVKIERVFRNYDLGWLYYIQTEGGSPNIGIPDDEFMDNNNLPYRLYVRQGRRIEGRYTLKESDIHKDLRGNGLRGPLNSNSVAIGVYGIDSHNVQGPTARKEPRSGVGAAEGTLHLFDVTGPYQIPYGVMVPKQRQGILFPVGISSTHVAMCTVRMEPVWSSLGQAAGVAAALAVNHGLELDKLSVSEIQDELVRQGCVLFFYTDLPRDAPAFEAVQKLSLLGAVANNDPDRFHSEGPSASLTDLNKKAYRFRPKELVTMSEFARMVVMGFQIPLSITAAHFSDVPRGHPAFHYIETLYDYSTQSHNPFFDFKIQKETGESTRVLAYPDQEVTRAKAIKIISGLLEKKVKVWPKVDDSLTRGEAAQLVYLQKSRGYRRSELLEN